MYKFMRTTEGMTCLHTFKYNHKDYEVVVSDPDHEGGLTKEDKALLEQACAIKRDEFLDGLQGRVV